MIIFFFETNFELFQKAQIKIWLRKIAERENKRIKELNIVFYNDEQLLDFNKKYLNHDTYTDIITFDDSKKNILKGDILISVERVKENAETYHCTFEEELRRVMAHGLLHLCGYNDKDEDEKMLMNQKEEEALVLFNELYNS